MQTFIVLFQNVTKENTNLQIECGVTKALAKVASLSLNSVTITGRQCSRPPRLDLGWLCSFTEASVTFGNPSQRFLQVPGIFLKSSESSSKTTKHSLSFLEQVQVSSTWLNLDWLCGFDKASLTFRNPSQRFLEVPGISPKTSESSSRRPENSLSFLCDFWILTAVLYKYEALPLQKYHLFYSLTSLNPRINLRLSSWPFHIS